MANTASELAHRLADQAEAVCRRYLPNGRREGRYWLVGDIHNTAGRSLFVRLRGDETGTGAAGKWTDAATGEHGDLLDLIRAARGLATLRDVLGEARTFLGLDETGTSEPLPPAPTGSTQAARRLFAASKPIAGTLAQTYLRSRGITNLSQCRSLRFHPRCYYRPAVEDTDISPGAWPALIAAVTDLAGGITGVHRTWLDPTGRLKAPVATPRRAMGSLTGHGVRFGQVADVMAAGEGIETVLSLRNILPGLPMVAALSAHHLAVLGLPASLRRLYIARDNDPAGDNAAERLAHRARDVAIEVLMLEPALDDFNDDLRRLGAEVLRSTIRAQLAPEDVARFFEPTAGCVKA